LAVVPVKGRDGAKSRLAPLLPPEERVRLVLDMLERVLQACADASAIGETLLVTPDPSIAPPGLAVLLDAGIGHADAVAAALRDERARAGVVVVMADCPLVRAESIDALAVAARPFALAPARDGGVNAIALREPEGFMPRFGVSSAEMAAAARAAGLEPAVVDDPGLAFDVDRPEDLAFA
jgi:2-phospho-L-lactate/phosphoenolpyruvate guanylyltransferase